MIDVSKIGMTTIRHLMSLRKSMPSLAIGEFLAKMSDALYELHKSAYVDPYNFPGRKPKISLEDELVGRVSDP